MLLIGSSTWPWFAAAAPAAAARVDREGAATDATQLSAKELTARSNAEQMVRLQGTATAAYNAQDFTGALAALSKLSKLDPSNPNWIEGRAQVGHSPIHHALRVIVCCLIPYTRVHVWRMTPRHDMESVMCVALNAGGRRWQALQYGAGGLLYSTRYGESSRGHWTRRPAPGRPRAGV